MASRTGEAAKIDNYYSKMNEMPNRSHKLVKKFLVKSQNELDQVRKYHTQQNQRLDPPSPSPNVKRRQEIGPYNVIAVQKVQKVQKPAAQKLRKFTIRIRLRI